MSKSNERMATTMSGWTALLGLLAMGAVCFFIIYGTVHQVNGNAQIGSIPQFIGGVLLILLWGFLFFGFFTLQPNQSAVLMLFGSSVVNTALSSIITFAPTPLYGYELMPGFWGLSMQEDQFIGGALMWTMGAMLRLGAISILFFVYVRQENIKNPPLGRPVAAPAVDAENLNRGSEPRFDETPP